MALKVKNLSLTGDDKNSASNRWLKCLLADETRLEIDLMNFPGRVRMPPQWRIQSMEIPAHLFYYVAEGSFKVEIGEEKFEMLTGDLIWLEPGVRFSFLLRNDEPPVIWRFRLNVTSKGRTVLAPRPVSHVSPATSCERWIESIIDEVSNEQPWSKARLRGLLVCLSTEIFQELSHPPQGTGELHRAQIAAIKDFVEKSAHQRLTVSDLAAVVQLSPDYFTRCFRRSFGRAPRRWLVEQRMRQAALRLLESDLRVGEIADEFGYPDVFAFSKQFKLIMGSSPLVYRGERGRLLTNRF